MSPESNENARSEERALYELATIEQAARFALWPTEALPPPPTHKKRHKKQSADKSMKFDDRDEALESMNAEMESMGAIIVVSSRDELERAYKALRPAFEAIVELFRTHSSMTVSGLSYNLYEQLWVLMQSAYRIGAQATVSTRAEHVVAPKVKRDGISVAREKRENNENERQRDLDNAILQATADLPDGKLVNSVEFAGLIYSRVRTILGIDKKQKWPTAHTIRNHIGTLIEARRVQTGQSE